MNQEVLTGVSAGETTISILYGDKVLGTQKVTVEEDTSSEPSETDKPSVSEPPVTDKPSTSEPPVTGEAHQSANHLQQMTHQQVNHRLMIKI